MHNAVAVIMGGGQGKRLQPLTRDRAKPAVPIGGKYRLVDIPISNCINSDIRKIFLLTQFNSVSLHQHVTTTYRFDQFSEGLVRILAAQQTPSSEAWFQGTADAVRQGFRYFMDTNPDYIVVLSGDQLYRMDLEDLIQQHIKNGAEVTIAAKPVSRAEAGALGILRADVSSHIVEFVEKPGDSPVLDKFRAPMCKDERFLASMGIYVFNTAVLEKLLDNEKLDFGKEIIPGSISTHKVCTYLFDGYWKDIGTVRSFWEENLHFTDRVPEFNFYDQHAPIFTRMRYLPPSKINCCDVNQSLLCEGCIISGHRILHSIIGMRAIVGDGAVIEHSYIMGADYYGSDLKHSKNPSPGIGRDCFIRNAIVDKNAHIGDGAYISPEGKPKDIETPLYTIRDGVICIPKNAVIPPGTRV
ncbi:MAG: glucose-1-phosphate adenylyltransferase [Verrucomicrobia bacterium]|nr:MAG: glucose-1-phosphate adenylyltransferase [Verrucomicrobiota bacterium]